ncbi:MAG TPA: hypothetical protein ENF64_00765 [Hadesarchaea archaeon]|nr:hypothetical protein [Hadesarchaea archaeon]
MEQTKKSVLSVERLTIFFAATGAVAGIISGVMTSANIRLNIYSLLVAIILFYITYKLTIHQRTENRFLTVMVEESKAVKEPNPLTEGFFPFFILWLILWVMTYTMLIG